MNAPRAMSMFKDVLRREGVWHVPFVVWSSGSWVLYPVSEV